MAGRPTEYKPEYCVQVEKLCKLGATDKEIGDFFEVDESTINRWKLEYPEFCESIKKGKIVADAEIAHSLFHRAKGYTHDAIKIFPTGGETKDKEGNVIKGPLLVPYQEHYPPDTVAAIFWLKNRQKDKWRDKQEIDHRTPDGVTVLYKQQEGNQPLPDAD